MNASVKLIELVLPATVALKATVPAAHASAAFLGTERHGSGVVIDPAGTILTANYIVMGAEQIEVTLLDDTTLPARVVAHDYTSGMAVVDMGPKALAALRLGRSTDLELGQEVFIVGAAGGNRRRANNGVVTSLGPYDAYWEYSLDRAITTSAMNPGVGGGPLLDVHGRVVGIISLDLGEVGHFTLAIPAEVYTDHRDELVRGGRLSRPSRAWVGMYCYAFGEHVVIAGLLPGTPGEQAGLKAGDVVVAVDDQPVRSRRELYTALWARPAGTLVQFSVYRDSAVRQVPVTSGDAEEFFA